MGRVGGFCGIAEFGFGAFLISRLPLIRGLRVSAEACGAFVVLECIRSFPQAARSLLVPI